MGLPKDCKIKLENKYPKGQKNLITDIKGVKVGHYTLEDDERHIHTGVTAILPHDRNLFQEKVMAGVSVINGFGKSVGLVQIEELGTIESPILMTNTFAVGTALNASVKYMLQKNQDIGIKTGTVNCVVTECNDGELNDIRGLYIQENHVFSALENTSETFEEGSVGAGTGMCCMGLKGGIGSASRVVTCDGVSYTIGAILMSNFGVAGNLRIDGKKIRPQDTVADTSEKGSVIIVIATDLPLNERQLKRVAKRSTVSLSRVGSYLGNGSGDIAIAFSTGNILPHYSEKNILHTKMFHDHSMDRIFEATAEAVEEAIVSSLYYGDTKSGVKGKVIHSLQDIME